MARLWFFLDYTLSEGKEKAEEVFAVVKLPAKATSECQKASVSNATSFAESAEKVSKDFESR